MNQKFKVLAAAILVALTFAGCGAQEPPTPTVPSNPQPTPVPERSTPSTGEIPFMIQGKNGNHDIYALDAVEPLEDSPLEGKVIYWLGSSVTHGAQSKKESMADFIAKRNGTEYVKEAVSGTTLATQESSPESSYVSRMIGGEAGFDPTADIDAFICQISTNDTNDQNWPNISELVLEDRSLEDFDLSKTLDSVQYIIEYVHETWNCPVYFYSGAYFGDAGDGVRGNANPSGTHYGQLVEYVKQIAAYYDEKDGYRVGVIDLFNDEAFNASVTDSDYEYLMGDPVHPRRAGYLVWWTPYFEQYLYNEFSGT